MERIVFLTGRLAEPALRRVLGEIAPPGDEAPFAWEVREIGLQVAGLMTADMIRRRVAAPVEADRMLVPGRCRGDLQSLASHFGIPVDRGPEELKDLPQFFSQSARGIDLSETPELLIFAEIVDAPRLSVDAIVARAQSLVADGADVVDLGCLPDTPFAHLEDSVRALRAAGLAVSVDSLLPEELLRGGHAGADYLLSLSIDTLWIADEVAATPIVIGRTPQDEASLWQAVEELSGRGRAFFADPILDPIPYGLLASLVRYHRLRERYAQAPILMGVGNLTELVEADTTGINALLMGIAAELGAGAILTTQVSPHARRAVREADWARRIMQASVRHRVLPKGLSDELMTVHERRPFPDGPDEIAAIAREVRDPNFRVQVSQAGVHVYNRDGLRLGHDPFALWPQLDLHEDAGHAFYMGVETARAQIAWQLGKRYVQDQPLAWGCAADPLEQAEGATHSTRRTRPQSSASASADKSAGSAGAIASATAGASAGASADKGADAPSLPSPILSSPSGEASA